MANNITSKCVLLIRVSDPRQEREGLSLDNQEQTLRTYAAGLGFEVESEFKFQESADLKIRKRFHAMVEYVKKRPDISAIIGYRVDRMTRNYHDQVLLDDLRLNFGKELHFVYDRLVIGPRTVGRDIAEWDTKVYLAKQHINRLKEDAVATLEYKLKNGEFPSKAPLGYRNTKVGDKSWIEPIEPQARIVASMYSLYAAGSLSMDQVRKRIKETFNVDIVKAQVDRILQNRFYFGEMVVNGQAYPHVYETLISRAEFDRVQAVRTGFNKKSYKYGGLPFPYRGLLTCADCGCRITPERKRKAGNTYHYYHCTGYLGRHEAEWVTEQHLDEEFARLFKTLQLPEVEATRIARSISSLHANRTQSLEISKQNLTAARQRIASRLETLYEDRLDGLLSIGEYKAKRSECEQEVRRLDDEIANQPAHLAEHYRVAEQILQICQHGYDIFRVSKEDEKRALLKLVLQNCRLKGKRPLWELKEPFKTAFSCGSCLSWGPLVDMFQHGSNLGYFDFGGIDALLRGFEKTTKNDAA